MSENAADAGDDKPRLTEEEKKQNHIASGALQAPKDADSAQATC